MLAGVGQREAEVVPRLRGGRIGGQRLPGELDRTGRVAELPLRLAEQRKHLRLVRGPFERGRELVARPPRAGHVEIDARQRQPRQPDVGIERQRLAQLSDGLPEQIRFAFDPVGEAEQQVRFRRPRFCGENILQLRDGFGRVRRRGEEVRADAIDPLARRRRRRLRRRPLRHAGQHDGQQAEGQHEPAEGMAGHRFRVLHVPSGGPVVRGPRWYILTGPGSELQGGSCRVSISSTMID